jgi:hypothetical protein
MRVGNRRHLCYRLTQLVPSPAKEYFFEPRRILQATPTGFRSCSFVCEPFRGSWPNTHAKHYFPVSINLSCCLFGDVWRGRSDYFISLGTPSRGIIFFVISFILRKSFGCRLCCLPSLASKQLLCRLFKFFQSKITVDIVSFSPQYRQSSVPTVFEVLEPSWN